MKRSIMVLALLVSLPLSAFPVVFSGANLPYDSSFHLGVVDGPGAGIDVGADILFPVSSFKVGAEVEQLVTDSNYEQNLNILKYGVLGKWDFSEDFYMTFHLGLSSFYIAKAVDFVDSFSGDPYTIDDDTHGRGTYYAVAAVYRLGEYYLGPKLSVNRLSDGGSIAELDLNLIHPF